MCEGVHVRNSENTTSTNNITQAEMKMNTILMPKATAVWLIENTVMTFEQISEFCGLHILEVKGIADGDVAVGILGADPLANGQLTRSEIERAEQDATYKMQGAMQKENADTDMLDTLSANKRRKTPTYVPVLRRQDRPDAIAWLTRNHPEVTDAQISRLIGTTKPTIKSIRDRTHWKMSTITPTDPVSLGLCTQMGLDDIVMVAAEKKERQENALEEATQKADAQAQQDAEQNVPQIGDIYSA